GPGVVGPGAVQPGAVLVPARHWTARSAAALAAVAVLACAGCSSVVGSMASGTLSAAILNQDDPELIEAGAPAYLLLVDGLISQNPDDETLLAAGAQLFALYGSRFAEDPARSVALTAKARRYGTRAMCAGYDWACAWDGSDYEG